MKKLLALGTVCYLSNFFYMSCSYAASCYYPPERYCIDYTGSLWKQNERALKNMCTAGGSIYSKKRCLAEERVGSCLILRGQMTETVTHYNQGSPETIRFNCERAGGEWL